MRAKKISFKIKVLIPIIVVFVLSVFAITAINYRLLYSTVRTKTNTNIDILNNSLLAQIKHLEIILETTEQTLNDKHLAIAKSIAYILDNSYNELTPKELQKLAEPLDILQLNIADSKGILINSNIERYIGFDYRSKEATRIYMALAEGEMIELSEVPRVSVFSDGIYSDINHYTGVALANGGFVQLGFDAGVLGRLQSEINIERTIKETKLGGGGYGLVLSKGRITAHPDSAMCGEDVSLTDWYSVVSEGNGFEWIEINGAKYYAGYKNKGDHTVVGIVTEDDYYKTLNQALLETIAVMAAAIMVMIGAVYLFLGKLLRPIKTLSQGLDEIAKGDLNVRVEGNYNDEFGEIKHSVNLMVDRIKRITELEKEVVQSQISIMLSQIHPHFLCNSLVAIQELCLIDSQMASEAIGEFSSYLRGNIDALSVKRPIAFEKELYHAEAYLSLEKLRFGEKVNIIYEINTRDFQVPTLTLQPIVENAVRHGITKRENGGTIIIRTEIVNTNISDVIKTESNAVITVIDDGVGFESGSVSDKDERLHVGIENVRARLEAMCGGTLHISSKLGEGTIAIITIPKGEMSE